MPAHFTRVTFLVALLSAPTVLLAQAVEKSTDLASFDTLEIGGCFDTRLVPGTPQRMTVTATAEQHERIRVLQEGAVVSVGPMDRESWFSNNDLCRGDRITVHVTANFAANADVQLRVRGSGDLDAEVPAAASLTASVGGSGDIDLRGAARDCRIDVSGSGDVIARGLDCAATTEGEVHGSGSITLQGKTGNCEFEIHGSGDIDAQDYLCNSGDVEVHGSGSVDFGQLGELAASIHGSGDVSYRGEPKLRNLDIHGSGRLHRQ